MKREHRITLYPVVEHKLNGAKMTRNANFQSGYAPNASVISSGSCQVTESLQSCMTSLIWKKYSKSQRGHFLIGGQRVLSAL